MGGAPSPCPHPPSHYYVPVSSLSSYSGILCRKPLTFRDGICSAQHLRDPLPCLALMPDSPPTPPTREAPLRPGVGWPQGLSPFFLFPPCPSLHPCRHSQQLARVRPEAGVLEVRVPTGSGQVGGGTENQSIAASWAAQSLGGKPRMRMSLRLWHLLPFRVTAPLWTSISQAVVPQVRFQPEALGFWAVPLPLLRLQQTHVNLPAFVPLCCFLSPPSLHSAPPSIYCPPGPRLSPD